MCIAKARYRNGSDGFILFAVLWIVAGLAALATVFSIYVSNTAMSLSLQDSTVQTDALMRSALELTAYQVTVQKPAVAPARGNFAFRLGRANVRVSFVSEASRIDINAAPSQLLSNFFTILGAQQSDAQQYAERIEAWTTKPRATSTLATAQDNEDALYRAAGLAYSPRGAPFAHIDELFLVLGVPAALIERARPFLTVYSGKTQINVLGAAPEVLAAVPGMTPDLAAALSGLQSAAQNPKAVTDMLAPISAFAAADPGDTYRVLVQIRYDNGRREASEIVILTGLADKAYRVMAWQDAVPTEPAFVSAGAGAR